MIPRSNSDLSDFQLSEQELEIVRAEVTKVEFVASQNQKYQSYLVLFILMVVQMSAQWSKFLISTAFNYDGNNTANAKYNISKAIPNFNSTRFALLTGPLYSYTFGASILFAGVFSDKYSRKVLLTIVSLFWASTSYGTAFSHKFITIALMRVLLGLFSAFA